MRIIAPVNFPVAAGETVRDINRQNMFDLNRKHQPASRAADMARFSEGQHSAVPAANDERVCVMGVTRWLPAATIALGRQKHFSAPFIV